MSSTDVATFDVHAAREDYSEKLVAHGILIPTGVDGFWGRSAAFESVVEALMASVNRRGANDGARSVRFPPLVTRANYLRTDHIKTMPQLSGSIHSFDGDERAHRELVRKVEAAEDYSGDLTKTDLVMCPAACYPVYPTLTGTLRPGGETIEVMGYCFRHEPSRDPMRMQMFRQHEYVRIGSPDAVVAFREMWFERATSLLDAWGIPYVSDVASDPFFGRAGKVMGNSQKAQALKLELNVPIIHEDFPTACVSLNLHHDHFAHTFDIEFADGSPVHTGCLGFGLERLTLGMFKFHGFDIARWPASVRAELGL
jgi:seryl-tRNA synthetase